MPDPAVVLGNGPSRLQLDLEEIPYDTFGANGIILEFRPTYLMYGDRKAVHEIRNLGIPHQKPPKHADVYDFESVGGALLHAACIMGYDPIYMIGFDGNAAGHACPKFGIRKHGWEPKGHMVAATDDAWRRGMAKVASMFPETRVMLLGDTPSNLDGLFIRAPLKPWLVKR